MKKKRVGNRKHGSGLAFPRAHVGALATVDSNGSHKRGAPSSPLGNVQRPAERKRGEVELAGLDSKAEVRRAGKSVRVPLLKVESGAKRRDYKSRSPHRGILRAIEDRASARREPQR